MTRPHERAVKRAIRKEAKDPGHSVPRGPSLLSSIEQLLLVHTKRYVEMQAVDWVTDNDLTQKNWRTQQQRGIVHGLAMAVARIRCPYEDLKVCTKRIEKDFVGRARNET